MSRPTPSVDVQRLDTRDRQPVQWLVPTWLARGVLALLDGDPGLGKSTLASLLAARLSRGQPLTPAPLPQGERGEGPPVSTLILSAEDDPARVLVPRLEAAGADLGRIHFVRSIGEEQRPVQLPDDCDALGEVIAREQAGLVIIDPLMAFLGRGVNASSDAHVRRALYRLKQLAELHQCAILIIRHLNKASHMPALYRGGGSIGILGACRLAWIVGKDPADEMARVLAMNKSNLGPPPKSLRYRLEQTGDVCRLAWAGECGWSAEEILRPMSEEKVKELSRVEECEQWLREYLGDRVVPTFDMELQASLTGFSSRTVERARQRLGVRSQRRGYAWEVWLPKAPGQAGDAERQDRQA